MTPSIANAEPRSLAKTISKEVAAPNHVGPLLRQAMTQTGLSLKSFAIEAKVAESTISDALAGRRYFACEWWWAQSDDFVNVFLRLVLDARQLPVPSPRAIRRKRIVSLINMLLATTTQCQKSEAFDLLMAEVDS